MLCLLACGGSEETAIDATPSFAKHPAACAVGDSCGGGQCTSISADSSVFMACLVTQTPTTEPAVPSLDECDNANPCNEGECFTVLQCEGQSGIGVNQCLANGCDNDAACDEGDNGLCVQAGILSYPTSRCIYGDCRVDSDCIDGTGGECTLVVDRCDLTPQAMRCVYDTDECHSDADCDFGNGETCDFFGADRPRCFGTL